MTVVPRMDNLSRRVRTAARYGRDNGLKALFALSRDRFRAVLNGERTLAGAFKVDVLQFYDFVQERPIGDRFEPGMAHLNTINWVVPQISPGSGGHLNIFRFIHHLEKENFECRVIIVGNPLPASAELARGQISEWFFPLRSEVYLGMDTAPPAHITVATAWQTAYYVRNFLPTAHRCYFVQDFEPSFYACGSEYAWADATYRFGFVGITAGTWLKEKLQTEYGMRAEAFSFAFDHHLYAPRVRREPEIRRVFFYARPPTPRRAFEMGLLILEQVVRRLPDVKVVFAGWDVSAYNIPFEHLNAGVVNLQELPDLYSQCDVALVLSFSNVSLLPLELMACGTPVVSNRGPYTEWLLNEDNACLAEPTMTALTDAVCKVLEDSAERERLRAGGLKTAAASDWRREARKVGEILRSLGVQEPSG